MTFSYRSNGIASILLLVLLVLGVFYLARGIYWVLSWATPVLLIAAAILDYKVYVRYGRYVWQLLRTHPVWGALVIVLSVVVLPLVATFLFFQALGSYQSGRVIDRARQRQESQWAEYEEVEVVDQELEADITQSQPLRPELLKDNRKDKQEGAGYEQLFD